MQLGLEPFFLIDENLSPSFAKALASTGFSISDVVSEFGGRKGVQEAEIIPWLSQHGQNKAVWVTKDWKAQKLHAKLIHEQSVSVLWILIPDQGLRALRELQLLVLVIEHVSAIVIASLAPVYLCASLNVKRPRLQRIVSPLTDTKLIFQRVLIPR